MPRPTHQRLLVADVLAAGIIAVVLTLIPWPSRVPTVQAPVSVSFVRMLKPAPEVSGGSERSAILGVAMSGPAEETETKEGSSMGEAVPAPEAPDVPVVRTNAPKPALRDWYGDMGVASEFAVKAATSASSTADFTSVMSSRPNLGAERLRAAGPSAFPQNATTLGFAECPPTGDLLADRTRSCLRYCTPWRDRDRVSKALQHYLRAN